MSSSAADWRDRIGEDLRRHEQERSPASPNISLGRYDLSEMLGEGAAAVVYRATDRELARQVAVKILREPVGAMTQLRDRFRQEGRLAAGISHPNVLAVHDVGEADGRLYLVMELVDGHPMSAVLRSAGRDFTPLVALLEKAAREVAAAHDLGIVHRDLKPGNIMVTRDGEPKVGDFGLARVVDSGPAMTRTGTVLGTPLYMAPEQVRGSGSDITPRTDVYALGAMLYEILTGRPPHTGEGVSEIFGKILGEEPTAPARLNGRVPADLETVALKALEKEPARRYANAREFGADLRRHLDGEPILAKPPGAVSRAFKAARRHRVVTTGIAAACVMSILWGGWTIAVARRSAVEWEAVSLLDTARPALELAERSLYQAAADPGNARRSVEQVQPLVEQAIAKAPHLAPAHHLMGRCWSFLAWDDRAEASFRRAIELDPAYGPARYQLGRLLMDRYLLSVMSLSGLEQGSRMPGAEPVAREAVRELETALSRSGFDDDVQREIASALLAYARGDFDAVRTITSAAIARHDGRQGVEELHRFLALVSSGKERSDSVDRAIALRPKYAMALLARGNTAVRALRADDAIGDLTAAIRIHPRLTPAFLGRGAAHLMKGDLDPAEADIDESLRLDPGQSGAHAQKAMIRRSRGDTAGALASFDQAIRLNPRLALALGMRGAMKLAADDRPGAVKDFDDALAINPDEWNALFGRAWIRHGEGRWADAIADLTRLLDIAPAGWLNRERAQALLADAKRRLTEH